MDGSYCKITRIYLCTSTRTHYSTDYNLHAHGDGSVAEIPPFRALPPLNTKNRSMRSRDRFSSKEFSAASSPCSSPPGSLRGSDVRLQLLLRH